MATIESKVCVVTFEDRGNVPYFQRYFKAINEACCRRPSYKYIYYQEYESNAVPPYWTKVKIVLDRLLEDNRRKWDFV